jgi:lipid-binding SYLF domain-containing protein
MNSKLKSSIFLIVFFNSIVFFSYAQVGGWNPNLVEESSEALKTMITQQPRLKTFKKESYAYAVFPKVIKGGVGIGAAIGNGVVYEDGVQVGLSRLKQASIGFQLGGQQYSELIFFQNKAAYDDFINGKMKFDAQVSAVAIKSGVSLDAAYNEGVAVFTMTLGGLMYQASVGGQHFKFEPK